MVPSLLTGSSGIGWMERISYTTTHSIMKSTVFWSQGGIGRWKITCFVTSLTKTPYTIWRYYHSWWVPIITESIGLLAWPPRTSPTRMRRFYGKGSMGAIWDNIEWDIDIKSMRLWESLSWRRHFSGAMRKVGRRRFFKLWIDFPHVHRRINYIGFERWSYWRYVLWVWARKSGVGMIRQLFLLLLLFFHVDDRVEGWELCGEPPGCYCQTPILHQIQCLDVTRFPSFEDFLKPGVLMFTFFKSPITEIQPFDEAQWPSLKCCIRRDLMEISWEP